MCRGSYVADVLKRGETEGGQVIGQGFSNAGSVPALGEEGEEAVRVTAPRQQGKVQEERGTHRRRCLCSELASGVIATWQSRSFSSSSHHREARHREGNFFSLSASFLIRRNLQSRKSHLPNSTIQWEPILSSPLLEGERKSWLFLFWVSLPGIGSLTNSGVISLHSAETRTPAKTLPRDHM